MSGQTTRDEFAPEELEDSEVRVPMLALPRPFSLATDFGGTRTLTALIPQDHAGPVHLEIGAGGGEFCVEYARHQPGSVILAVERKLNYLLRAIRKTRVRPAPNMYPINGDALYLLTHHCAPESFDAIHIYFPDPWPKRRHARRRIFRQRSLNLILSRIRTGGHLHIRTDMRPYFEAAMHLLRSATGLKEVETPDFIRQHQTNFERKFLARGLPIFSASFLVQESNSCIPDGIQPPDTELIRDDRG